MKQFISISLFVCFISTFSFARTPQEAANIASLFISQSHTAAIPRTQRAAAITNATHPVELIYTQYQADNTTPAVFVFNSQYSEGFVLVSAEDNARTILGYSDIGTFNQTDIPENMQFWLKMYADELTQANSLPRQLGVKINDPLPNIEPILKDVVWGQSKPFNNLCPIVNGERSVTGCVATALSQIMYAHKHPQQGTGSYSYSLSNNMQISEDFSQTIYDWEHMIPNYNKQYTEQEATAVATLMYHVGVASHMSYSPSASGAVSVWALQGLQRHFNYDADIKVAIKDYTLESTILTTIAEELQAGRPVYVSGRTVKDEGHAFICDGIHSDGYIHINWGWNGTGNGFYVISALDPGQQGTGGSSSNLAFTEDVTFYTNIRPDQGGEPTAALYAEATRESATHISRKDKVRFKLENISNAGIANAVGDYGFFIYDSLHNLVEEKIIYENLWFSSGYIYKYLDLSAKIASNLQPGNYALVIAYKDNSNTIHPLLIHRQGYPEYAFTLTSDSIYFDSNDILMPTTMQADWINKAGSNQWQMNLYSPNFWQDTTATDEWLIQCTFTSNSNTSIIGSYLLNKTSNTPGNINLAGAVCAIGNANDCKQYTLKDLQLTIVEKNVDSLSVEYIIEFNGQTYVRDLTLPKANWYQDQNGDYQDYTANINYQLATPLSVSRAINLSQIYPQSTPISYLITGNIATIHQTPTEILIQQSIDLDISEDGDNKNTLYCSDLHWINNFEWTTGDEIHASDTVVLWGKLAFMDKMAHMQGYIYQHNPVTHMPITSFQFNIEGMKMTSTWESEAPYFRVRLYDKNGKVVANNIINKKTITATMPAEGEYIFYIRPMQKDKKQFAGAAKTIQFTATTTTDTEPITENTKYDLYDLMGNKVGTINNRNNLELQDLQQGVYILVNKNSKKIFIP